MRGSLRLQIFSALVLPPVIVAAVLTIVAIRLFRQDKELYVYDSSAQTVDLVARDLSSKLDAWRARAELSSTVAPPFLSVTHGPLAGGDGLVRLDNVSSGNEARVRIRYPSPKGTLVVEVAPGALLDAGGRAGGSQLMLINSEGQLLAHPEPTWVLERRDDSELLRRLRLFEPGTPRVGTRALDLHGTPSLVAAARLPGVGAAVVQAVARQDVFAAAQPLITSAVLASAVVMVLVVAVALLLGRIIIRPLRLMTEQAAAIARGEFGVATEARAAGDVGHLAASLNTMSAALKRRDEELRSLQNQLLQAERLNTASRMVTKVASELTGPIDTCFSLAKETIRRLPERNDVRGLQERIASAADHAANILQNLLRVAERGAEPAAQQVDLEVLVADVLVSAGPLLDSRGLVLANADELGGPIMVALPSPDHLRSAVLDLLLHVAEVAVRGSTVTVACTRSDAGVTLGIRYVAQPGAAPGQSSLVLTVASMAVEEQGGQLHVQPGAPESRLEIVLPLVGAAAAATPVTRSE